MSTVRIRITLISPPPGVLFSLQDRSLATSNPVMSTGADMTFELEFTRDAKGGIGGKFAMGPPATRFFYVCSGQQAGQMGTGWSRRAKISLMNVPAGTEFAGEIPGRMKDGGPVCATVKLVRGEWTVAKL